LQYAERCVAANPQTMFSSLMIGANDLLLLKHRCAKVADINGCVFA
jgi:hypothetical protein